MNERVVEFGEEGRRVGVLTEPGPATKAPHLIILNAGFVHRVGPGRLAVDIARTVAELGFATLRFDLSGIGDSAPRVPPLDAIPGGIADTQEAMDYLAAERGAEQFLLLGLCSGARHAYHVALADSRVVGTIMLDAPVYASTRSAWLGFRDRLGDPLGLFAGAARRAARLFRSGTRPVLLAPDDDGDAFFPKEPARDQMVQALVALAARKVGLLYVFSGEMAGYRYEGQLRDAFPEVALGALLTERLIASADHLYFTRQERAAMLGIVSSWLREQFS